MATESFLVTALPYSAAAAEPFHVSLFITHRLAPDGAAGVVGGFPNVARWASLLERATFRLRGGGVAGGVIEIPVTPLLGVVEPDLWPRVFPADLPVRPWKVPNHTAVPWRTFPAHRMQQHALLVHAASIFSSPVDAPRVDGNALTAPILETLGLHQRRLSLIDVIDGVHDREITKRLDAMVEGSAAGGIRDAAAGSLRQLIADVHSARRFYQRDDGPNPYQERPTVGLVPPPIAKPTPDFHERASMLGDLSPLLRRLGLVIDLRVDDLARLGAVTWIQAEVLIPAFPNTIGSQPRTACRRVGQTFTAVSASGDYELGMLKLGDEARFRLLDLDPDASALKLEQYVRTMPRLFASERNGDPVNSAPSTLRATGFSLARIDGAQKLRARVDGAAAKDVAVVSGKAPPLALEQVNRGVRLEVWDDVSGKWHSLHRRLLTVEVEGAGAVLEAEPDAGFLQTASVTRSARVPGGPIYAHEVLAGWDGWSLSAPRPGNVVVHEAGKEVVRESPLPDPDPVNPVVSSTEVAPGTLPRLRYGRQYAFRAYAVDLAGNSRPHLVDGMPPASGTMGPASAGSAGAQTQAGGVAGAQSRRDDDVASVRGAGRAGKLRPLLDQIRLKPNSAGRVTSDVARNPSGRDVVSSYAGLTVSAREAASIADGRISSRSPDALRINLGNAEKAAGDELRSQIQGMSMPVSEGPDPNRQSTGLRGGFIDATGLHELDQLITSRLAPRMEGSAARGTTRSGLINQAFGKALAKAEHLVERTDRYATAQTASALSRMMEQQPGLSTAVAQGGGMTVTELLGIAADLITTPRPFLRWDPIIEPATLPRHAYTEGESLLRLVIRSGVDQAAPGDLAITVTAPAEYVAGVLAEHPALGLAWREDSQRHLSPPKTSQFEAELHSVFDSGFGASTPAAAAKAALGIALKESGSFMDVTIADIDNPGQRLPQPGVTFHLTPTAEVPEVVDPADLPDGDAPGTGQYVAHDVDELVLPYLPDPLAAGVAFTFPDAGNYHRLSGLLAVEGITLRYPGSWPERVPFRLVLESGPELGAVVEDHVVRISLPPGEQLRMRMSSSVARESLDLLGLWRSLPEAVRDSPLLREAAVDGWYWWLTPSTEVRLVHAVPKPIEAPRPTLLRPVRTAGDTAVVLFGAIDLHGPSTDRIDVEAAWSQWVDDVAKPEPEQVSTTAIACGTEITADQDLVVLSAADASLPLPDGSTLRLHAAVHQTGDTLHRVIDYSVRATTRYREYFLPQVTPDIDDISVVGPTRTLDVPSAARPRKVIVRDVLPLFRWDEETEPAQPFGRRRSRRAGVRLYLERPWFSSGDGELLGVIIASGDDSAVRGAVSQWAGDPVFRQQGPDSRANLPLIDLLHLTGLDDRVEGGRPARPAVTLPLVDRSGQPNVWVLGYQPEYSRERKLWFVDIAFDPGAAFWPFVQLAVARYQPSSLTGLHLGPVTMCDFVQLTPERTATLSRTDESHARVVVTGPVGHPRLSRSGAGAIVEPNFLAQVKATRTMRARLERLDPSVGTDLGWAAISQLDLPILGIDGTVVSWAGEISLPTALPPRTPGENAEWRVTLEEWEYLPADIGAGGAGGLQPRIVYADHLPL